MVSATMFSSLWFTVYPLQSSLTVLGIMVLAGFIIRPSLMYYVLVILMNLTYIFVFWTYRWDETFLLPESFLLMLIPLWLLSRALKISDPYEKSPCDVPILLFFSLAVFSLLWVTDYTSAVKQLVQLFIGIAGTFWVTISIINSPHRLRGLLKLVLVIGIINGVICFFSVYTYPDFPGIVLLKNRYMTIEAMFNISFVGRRGHAMAHPLTTAIWLDFAMIFGTVMFLTTRNRVLRICLVCAMYFILCALMTTLSKGPLLALIAGYLCLFLMLRPTRKFYFSSLVLMGGTVVSAFSVSHITRLKTIINFTAHQLSGADQGSSLATRMEWWGIAWHKCMDTNGFGVGIGNLPQYLTMNAPHPHSVYFSALGELGVLGLALLLWILATAVKRHIQVLQGCENEFYRRILAVYLGGFVTLLGICFLDLNYIVLVSWWYLGLGFAISKLASRASAGYRDESLPFNTSGKSMISLDWTAGPLR